MNNWIDVAAVEDLLPGQGRRVETDDITIAVYNIDGEYYAVEDFCSHDEVSMLECGLEPEEILDGDQIICPRHGARFCLRTGEALTPPAYEPVATFPTRVEAGRVQVRDNRED